MFRTTRQAGRAAGQGFPSTVVPALRMSWPRRSASLGMQAAKRPGEPPAPAGSKPSASGERGAGRHQQRVAVGRCAGGVF